jgi:hypothetical protein
MRRIDLDKIAKGLDAERRGAVAAGGGFFGAIQIVAEVQGRFRVPTGGGRATDPAWTKRRLVPLTEQTLERLEQLAHKIEEKRHVRIEPMQVAALLLENITENIADEDADQIVKSVSASD